MALKRKQESVTNLQRRCAFAFLVFSLIDTPTENGQIIWSSLRPLE